MHLRQASVSLAATTVALALVLTSSASAATPQSAGTLSRAGPPTIVHITFANGVARATIVVVNHSGQAGGLQVRYVGAGAPGGLVARAKAAPKGLSLVRVGGSALNARDATAVRVVFHRRAALPILDGALILRSPTGVVAVPIEETPAAPSVGFAQRQATLTTSAWLGPVARVCGFFGRHFFGGTSHCPGQHYDARSTTVVAYGFVAHETQIGGDNGATATVELKPADQATRATLTATAIPAPGAYAGDVGVTDALDAKTLSITVHARDILLWPLVVLTLGLVASYFLTTRHERWRAAQGLRVMLQDAVKPYLDGLGNRDPQRPDHYYLDSVLLHDASGVAGEPQQFQKPRRGVPKPQPEVPAIYWDTYDIGEADDRANVTAAVATMTARFGRWQRLDSAFLALRGALQPLPPSQISDDGQSMLDLAQGEPVDDDETKARAATMAAFAGIAALYGQVNQAFTDAAKTPGWSDTHQYLNPVRIYDEARPLKKPEETAELRISLLRARRLLANPAEAPEDNSNLTRSENLRFSADLIDDVAGAFVADVSGVEAVAALLGPFTRRFEDSAAIRRNVRHGDWVVFVVLSVLTALAYTLGFYAGKDWVSLNDYLLAFTAGVTVPTVINWALLPSARTLTAESPS